MKYRKTENSRWMHQNCGLTNEQFEINEANTKTK